MLYYLAWLHQNQTDNWNYAYGNRKAIYELFELLTLQKSIIQVVIKHPESGIRRMYTVPCEIEGNTLVAING